MIVDLHCHTKISDGSMSIEDIIALAKRRSVGVVSITDHDTFAGVTRAQVLGARIGVKVISGIEFSCIDEKRNRKVHILGYLCDNPERIEGLCRKIAENRKQAMLKSLQKVMRYYPITPEMISRRSQGSTNIFKQHIMHLLVDAGYTSDFYGDLFHKLFNSENGLAKTEIEYPEVRSVVSAIHSAGGIAVLAHPTVYDSCDLFEELVKEENIDGVELWHPRVSEEDFQRCFKLAHDNKLVKTGGTDFHGMYTAEAMPIATFKTPLEEYEYMLKYKDRKKRKAALAGK